MEEVADVDVNFGLMHGLGIEAHPVVAASVDGAVLGAFFNVP